MSSQKNIREIELFSERIISWFENNGRVFPWRSERDAFRLLVTEILLQKTQANMVAKIYDEFFSKYPNAFSIYTTSLDELKNILRPLGLVKRAATLFHVARLIIEEWNGVVPGDAERLLKIPGVGNYTVNSVLCHGFGFHCVAVDGNVARLLSRHFGIVYKSEQRRIPKGILELTKLFFPVCKARELNYGLLDVGAIICKARKPKCAECPVRFGCEARASVVPFEEEK